MPAGEPVMLNDNKATIVGQRAMRIALAAAIALAGVCGAPPLLAAAATGAPKDDGLEEIVVTGTLIPTHGTLLSTPALVISAEDMKARGFETIADALQTSSFATGSIQGPQSAGSGSFTGTAQTVSLFGFDPSYTKVLLDGRPMPIYPALYNGSVNFTSISGIPQELVDHIDILPGGQSSIYGSDAIAGVVNIVLKKSLDGPVLDVRGGWSAGGGGEERRIAFADSFDFGKLKLLAGVQYEKIDPIWGYQRPLTASNFANGTTPLIANPYYLIYGYYGQANGNTYYFEDPANCAGLASQYGGSVVRSTRPTRGDFCGSTRSGYQTIGNGDEGVQAYLRLTDDLSDQVQLYAETLLNHDDGRYSTGANTYNSSFDPSSSFYNYYDPNLGDLLNVQHVFSPEEVGGLNNTLNKNTVNAYRATLGARGNLGTSAWTYDASLTYDSQRLTETYLVLFSQPVESFFAPLFGPSQGVDPYGSGFTAYTPNYAAFYKPVTPAQYAGFAGFTHSYSRTEESLLRAQLTNPTLFALPGGNAGLAVVLEGGGQGWVYAPDSAYLNGAAFGQSATSGSGHRTRTAATTELRLPVLSLLTLTASGRFDDYHVGGSRVSDTTFNLGLELRPTRSLLLRGRYGTAFKAPTLADEFQGDNTSYSTLNDYYQCYKAGYTPANIASMCPQYGIGVQTSTSGNTQLRPITATVWDIGAVWTPVEHLSLQADLLEWNIRNEVNQQSADQLLKNEAACRLGQLPASSSLCAAALAQVSRDASGQLLNVSTPKVNVSAEDVRTLVLGFAYQWDAAVLGRFEVDGSWTDMIQHTYQLYPGDAPSDYLYDPTQSQEFKSKVDASLTWKKGDFSATLFMVRDGPSPNYLATLNGYATPGAGRLPAWTLYNLGVHYQVTPALIVYANADNLFDKMPPIDNSYPGTTNFPYNVVNYNAYGRSYLVEASYRFGK